MFYQVSCSPLQFCCCCALWGALLTMSWSACPLQQIEAQPCLSSNSRIAATILDPLVWTAAFILAGKMSNLLPSPPAMSLCLHRNASPQGAWWQSSKSLYLPIFSDEMAGNTQVCLCCTTIPDISCQCGGALGFIMVSFIFLNTTHFQVQRPIQYIQYSKH